MEAHDRSKRVLAALVREYIASGEPVASSLLVAGGRPRGVVGDGAQHPRAARGRRIRAAAAHLGRAAFRPIAATVSTSTCCSTPKRPSANRHAVEARLRKRRPTGCIDSLLPQVSHMVSQASRHIGFAVRPAHEAAVFDRVEFIPLSGARVLVVIVARGGHVIQKVIDVTESLTADDLRQASNYLNAEFSGLPLHRAREAVARAHQRRTAALRRAAGPGDAARDVDVRRPARTTGDLRRRRRVAARRRARAHARIRCRRCCR